MASFQNLSLYLCDSGSTCDGDGEISHPDLKTPISDLREPPHPDFSSEVSNDSLSLSPLSGSRLKISGFRSACPNFRSASFISALSDLHLSSPHTVFGAGVEGEKSHEEIIPFSGGIASTGCVSKCCFLCEVLC